MSIHSSIDDQAASWFARDTLGALSADEQRALDAWLAADARHRLAYADVAAAAFAAQQAAPAPGMLARRPSRVAAWLAGAAAAPLALLLALVVPTAVQNLDSDAYTTVGAIATRTLPDASTLMLDTDSAVDIAFDADARRVELLRGALDVAVTKDPSRPFYVQCDGVTVRAIGTRFGVAQRGDAIEVSVTEGRVGVTTAQGEPFELGAGEHARIETKTLAVARGTLAPDAMAWTRGVLRFERTRLADALREIDRYVPERITLASGHAGEDEVTAVFPLDDPHAALAALAAAQGLKVRRVPGLLYHLDEP